MSGLKNITKQRVLAIIVAIIFVAIEAYVLSFAKFRYDHAQSTGIAEELSIQLSLISVSMQSGNKAAYSQALADYRKVLDDFGKNPYVQSRAHDLLTSLQNYSGLHMEESELISQYMELRVATANIETVSDSLKSSEIDAIKVYDFAHTYIDFREGIAKIDAPELADLISKLTNMSNEIIQITEKSAVCVSACQDGALTEKQNTVEDITNRYKDELTKLSLEASEKFNPNQLILDLNNYSKL
jgi:hypothetical protein